MTLRIFDFHLHLCKTAKDEARVYHRPGWDLDWYWGNEARISQYLDFWRVDKAVVLNIIDTGRMTRQRVAEAAREGRDVTARDFTEEMQDRVRRFNAWLCDLARKEDRILPFVMADPVLFGDSVLAEIRQRVESGARGVKVHPTICGHLPADPRARPIYKFCQDNELTIVTDTLGFETEGTAWGAPAGWRDVLPDFPRLRIVLAHLPGERWDEMIEIADSFPNVRFDISGGFVDEAHPPASHRRMPIEEAARVIRRIGVERVFFGSDAPAHGREVPDAAGQLLQLPLSDTEREAVLYGNAAEYMGV